VEVTRRSRGEPYITAQQAGKRLGVAWPAVLREYRLGLIPGRRMRDGTVRFRWSEVVEAWDGRRQLSFEDDAS
jgi:predicted site-specific integrase-resolvase